MSFWKLLSIAGLLCSGACGIAFARQSPEPRGTITLQIDVTGVRNAKGNVHVDICRQAEFLKNCPVMTQVSSVAGTTALRIPNLAPGVYAAQVFHDENANSRVDRGLFGIPKEGVGFSNDAPIRFSPPKWADAMFQLTDDKTITLKIRYFSGSGPKK